jgi:hypothetical protein
MKRKHLATIITAPLLMLAWTLSCRAADATAPTTCKDGTTSTAAGRGACSGHGGVQKATKAGAAAAAPAAAPAPATVAPPASAAPAASPATAASKPAAASKSSSAATSGNTDPTGATAKCKDGTYSKSQHQSGTCSNHGGVAEWLTAAH